METGAITVFTSLCDAVLLSACTSVALEEMIRTKEEW